MAFNETNARFASPEEIMGDAVKIWKEVGAGLDQIYEDLGIKGVTIDETSPLFDSFADRVSKLHLGLVKKWSSFSDHFPVVLRFMTHRRFFVKHVMQDYLKWLARDWSIHNKSAEAKHDYLRRQVEYVVRVEMEMLRRAGQHPGLEERRAVREKAMAALAEDEKTYEKMRHVMQDRQKEWQTNKLEGERERLRCIVAEWRRQQRDAAVAGREASAPGAGREAQCNTPN